MGPSEKAFQQVRNILGKLDRNIDQLRTQRVQPAPAAGGAQPAPSAPGRPAPGLHSTVGTSSLPGSGAGSTSPASGGSGNGASGGSGAPSRAPSAYGRATPIPPSGN